MSIHDYPRCAAYLKQMHVNLNDPAMSDYWFGVILGEEAFTEEGLALAGVAFTGHIQPGILDRLEVGFPRRRGVETRDWKNRDWLDKQDMDRLRAFFGSRGVKAGELRAVADFWSVAEILWPAHVKNTEGGLADLMRQIERMSKKQRQSASANIRNVPAQFLGKQFASPSHPIRAGGA